GNMTEAIASGFGQILSPVKPQGQTERKEDPLYFVIVLPEFSCATADVYREFDRIAAPNQKVDITKVKKLSQKRPIENQLLFNDLAPAAITVQPKLGKLMASVEKIVGR